MTHDHSSDLTLQAVERGLDALAEADASTMSSGLAQRVAATNPAPDVPVPVIRLSAFQRVSIGLAAAAALALLALPVWLNKPAPAPSPMLQASYDADALELFEVATASLASGSADRFDALLEDTQSFDAAAEPDTSWLEESEAI